MARNYIKTQKIGQLFERDRQAFTAMGHCGYITKDHMAQCGVKDGRLRNYIRDGYVKQGDKGQGYKLTDQGKELLANQWGLSKTYNAQSEKHDIGIANKYFSLSQEERDSWKNESMLRIEFHEKMEELRDQGKEELAELYEKMYQQHEISMSDGSYISNGIEIYYEVITNNYGEAELMAKEALVQIMEVSYETNRV